MGEWATRSLSEASCDSSASRSAWRRLSSDSSATIWAMSVACDIRARTRLTLARMVLTRLSVSTYWSCTFSLLVSRRMTVPTPLRSVSARSRRSAGTEMVISP